ncbi:MAG: hypothetical protein ACRD88_08190 [Terriglobia bacterium]
MKVKSVEGVEVRRLSKGVIGGVTLPDCARDLLGGVVVLLNAEEDSCYPDSKPAGTIALIWSFPIGS